MNDEKLYVLGEVRVKYQTILISHIIKMLEDDIMVYGLERTMIESKRILILQRQFIGIELMIHP